MTLETCIKVLKRELAELEDSRGSDYIGVEALKKAIIYLGALEMWNGRDDHIVVIKENSEGDLTLDQIPHDRGTYFTTKPMNYEYDYGNEDYVSVSEILKKIEDLKKSDWYNIGSGANTLSHRARVDAMEVITNLCIKGVKNEN